MKKFALILAAIFSVALISCQKSVADQLADAYEKAAERMANATSAEDVVAVETELSGTIQNMEFKDEDLRMSGPEQQKVEAAYAKFESLYKEKISQFGPAANAVDVETFQAESADNDSAENTGTELDASVANRL